MSYSVAFIPAIPLSKSRHHAVRRAEFRNLNSHRVYIHPLLCAPSPSPPPSSSSPNFSSSTQQHTSTSPVAQTFSAPPVAKPASPTDALLESAIELALSWVTEFESSSASQQSNLVANLSTDPSSVAFVMKFTDWVMRPDNSQVAARMFARLLQTDTIPDFLHAIDAFLLKLGGKFAQIFPWPVIFAARLRMQAMVSDFVGAVETLRLNKASMQWNVNLLGEAVLGEEEALKRRLEAEELVGRDDVDYVSVKVSGVTSQLNRWDFEGSLERVLKALRPLFRRAATSQPRVLINLDMEEYHDLEITLEAFIKLLDEEEFIDLDAGIVLQTYLPDSFEALKKLVNWANNRRGTAEIKIRLVKGANLAMEKVDAAIHGWEQAPYEAKVETDANYLRCLNWVLTPERTRRVRIGVASHNVFLLAYATALSRSRGVSHRVGFEMLKGMTPTHTPFLAKQGHGMLLYTPVCRMRDFDVAISYLFRRFEEMTATGNFLRSLPNITVKDSATFRMEEARFRAAFATMNKVATRPRRTQTRPAMASAMTIKGLTGTSQFFNEPNTDPALPETRKWALEVLKDKYYKPASLEVVESVSRVHEILNRGREAATEWASRTPAERRRVLSKIADVLARRRGDLINAMIYEGRKTFAEADSEVSEAIDFAHYYGMMAENLPQNFKPFGLMCVVAPWNFPVAIVCGGVLSSLAAGNCVVLKPSSLTRRCGQLVAECAWEAGLPADVLQVIGVQGMEPGKELVTGADGVVLTGSSETAKLFKSWNSDIRLFAETSGKNSLIISPAADIDLAVADLVQSAFSNTGQRCSASSLAICIGDVYTSDRFLRQLKDAVETIVVGPGTDISTVMGPLIKAPRKGEKLYRALTTLEPGETWLVKPKCLDKDDAGEGLIWTPGVKLGVRQGSWFHQNEVFGPVLGVMHAENLQHALALQNGNRYGLTGGLHSLDNTEIENWMEHVNVGNAYVNRGITGAIVQRQPFGGWKDSVIGPGAKAGGVNYVAQFGTIAETEGEIRNEEWLKEALQSDEREWKEHFVKEHDDAALFCEGNVFRYRPLPCIAVRIGQNSNDLEVRRVRAAVERCAGKSTTVLWSKARDESVDEFVKRLEKLHVRHEIRVRTVGEAEQVVLEKAAQLGVHVAANSAVKNARVELLHYLREQSVSSTRHRFGNLVTG